MNWHSLFAQRTRHMRRSAVRELLKVTARPDMISFAGGMPAPELFPIDEIRQAVDAVLSRRGRAALQYGETEGVGELRDWIAARCSRPDFRITRDNVMIVSGSQQALDLIGRVFLDAGDRVLVENPTYLALLSAWRPQQPVFVPAPSDDRGLCVDALPPLLNDGVKLAYLVPNFQNPQGTTLSLDRRNALLRKLRRSDTVLVEDDPYGELRFSGTDLPSLLELDASSGPDGCLEGRVIHLGSFSKTLAPGLRVGWVIAPEEVIDRLVLAKQSADLHTSTLSQHVILELVRDGVLERQVPKLCRQYGMRRDRMLEALGNHFPSDAVWTRPDGGMFLLVTLPETVQARDLLPHALAQNVAFVPGDDFHLDHRGGNTLRLNYSNAMPDRIEEGVRRLGLILKKQMTAMMLPAAALLVPVPFLRHDVLADT